MTDLTYGLVPYMSADPDRVLASQAHRLAQKSAALSALPPATRRALQSMLRTVNTYYSNLIEGQSTHRSPSIVRYEQAWKRKRPAY